MTAFSIFDRKLVRHGLVPQTISAALDESIQKWKFIFKNRVSMDGGCKTCGLCIYTEEQGGLCLGCPIYKYTGKSMCACTPWRGSPTRPDALKELTFLRWIKFLRILHRL